MKKKKTKKAVVNKPINFLTVCADCKIKLIVRKENNMKCYLCKSTNITVTTWK